MKQTVKFILGASIVLMLHGCANTPHQPAERVLSKTDLQQQVSGIEHYHQGRYQDAVDALIEPAMHGMAESQYYLGLLFDQSATDEQDFQQAKIWYEQAAAQNHAGALNNLGVMHDKGLGVEKDREIAAEYFRKAALKGYARAKTNIGVMYVNGRGVDRDIDSAIYWFSLAAATGESDAMINLGYIAESGMADKVDYVEALHWYEQARLEEDINAYFRLASMYANGRGVEADQFKASSYFYQAAASGHLDSQLALWERYRDGTGVAKDIAEATSWLQRAADQGNSTAQLTLGKSYLFGSMTKQSDELALYWLYNAADAGELEAQGYLGYLFEHGIGIEKNTRQAYVLYRHIAGFDYPIAQLGLSRLLANKSLDLPDNEFANVWYERAKLSLESRALGGDPEADFFLAEWYLVKEFDDYDQAKAKFYFERAAKQGSLDVANDRLLAMADESMYALENGVQLIAEQQSQATGFQFFKDQSDTDKQWPLNTAEALDLFMQAANDGHVAAQVKLGLMYQYGGGVDQDFELALSWYSRAAEQDSAIAQFGLGEIYMLGQGVVADASAANHWFGLALEPLEGLASEGDIEAQTRLGKMYTYGYGVERDYIAAHELLRVSQEQGSVEAEKTILELETFMRQVKRFVGVQTAYVRSTPDPLAPVVETLEYGSEVLELERHGGWVKVNFASNTENSKGWVYSPLITANLDQNSIVGRY